MAIQIVTLVVLEKLYGIYGRFNSKGAFREKVKGRKLTAGTMIGQQFYINFFL